MSVSKPISERLPMVNRRVMAQYVVGIVIGKSERRGQKGKPNE